MKENLQDLRKSYDKDALLESNVSKDPFEQFEKWFKDASQDDGVEEVNAMSINTLGEDGFPKSRIVLLKEIEEGKFIFYTNYTSEKATSIEQHSKVGLHFFWPSLERQVIIKANATRTSKERSAAYFNSRPRGSQLGAWASHQSKAIESRQSLEDQLNHYQKKFEGRDIPMPDFWGGFECTPVSFEFWQGRPNRLHDRIFYERVKGDWQTKRLQP